MYILSARKFLIRTYAGWSFPHMVRLQQQHLIMMVRKLMRGWGQVARMSLAAGSVKDLNDKAIRGGPEILNIPKILGGVVAATTNGEPLVQSSISVSITKKF